jgi:hypothetical protein
LDIYEVDEQTDQTTDKNHTYALSASIRMMGEADHSLLRLTTTDQFIGKGYLFKDNK